MKEELIQEHKRDSSKDHLIILQTVKKIPFGVGKKLLVDFLKGNNNNKSIKLKRLNTLQGFGELSSVNPDILYDIIQNLISNQLLDFVESNNNRFMKYLQINSKGLKELAEPTLNNKKLKSKFIFKKTIITEEDKEIFKELDSFLNNYNPEQKKAIISNNNHILCIAGAGSGKTTALTKRIEFLVKYRAVNPGKILAITFTRKAKQEMINRLTILNIYEVKIETFNSFCEGILRKYGQIIYNRNVRVMNYGDKAIAFSRALQNLNLKIEEAVNKYFSIQQKRSKTREQLQNIFMNDCFSILDYFKVKRIQFYDFSIDVDDKDKENVKMIYNICKYLKEHMFRAGLRDYSDQVLDALNFLKQNKEFIPEFKYILVDEYQDVNSMQIELLDTLQPSNLFVVGDPRQSIFGWRGSDINYILDFEKKFPGCEIISLTKNYRSSKNIITFMNKSIEPLGLPNLDNHLTEEGQIKISEFDTEEEERRFVIEKILKTQIPKHEIFILARTNKQLEYMSRLLTNAKIKHIVKNDEIQKPTDSKEDHLTLATIHAIKGLEAEMVFVIGINEQNFPCKASDHPVIEMVKVEDYDKEEEERRLFYVAVSRAKKKLYLSHKGKITRFVNGIN